LVAGKTAQALREAVEALESRTEETHVKSEVAPPDAPPKGVSDAEAAADADTVMGQQVARKDAARREGTEGERSNIAVEVLSAVAIVIIGNTVMVTMAGLLDWWEIYDYGWTIELFLVSLGLCVIMGSTRIIWMLIPIGIILGNGILLSFSQIFDAWGLWSFLWILEIWIVGGTVWLTIWLGRQGEWVHRLSRPLAQILGLASISCGLLVFVASAIIGLFNWVF